MLAACVHAYGGYTRAVFVKMHKPFNLLTMLQRWCAAHACVHACDAMISGSVQLAHPTDAALVPMLCGDAVR